MFSDLCSWNIGILFSYLPVINKYIFLCLRMFYILQIETYHLLHVACDRQYISIKISNKYYYYLYNILRIFWGGLRFLVGWGRLSQVGAVGYLVAKDFKKLVLVFMSPRTTNYLPFTLMFFTFSTLALASLFLLVDVLTI